MSRAQLVPAIEYLLFIFLFFLYHRVLMCSITDNCTCKATYDGTLSSCVDMYCTFLDPTGGGGALD
jgi:hypothetical protein